MTVKTIIVRKKGPNKYTVSLKFENGKEKGKTLYISDITAEYIRRDRGYLVNLVNTLLKDGANWNDIFEVFMYYNGTSSKPKIKNENVDLNDFKNKVMKGIVNIMNEIAGGDIDDGLVGAKVMAVGDALSYINYDKNLKFIIQKLPKVDKFYIGEGYDYKTNSYAYIVVKGVRNPRVELEIETK